MLTLVLSTVRTRWKALAGAFVTLLVAAAVVTACGLLMESGLRAGVPTERYAAAAVVIGGQQQVPGGDADEIFPERVGVPAELVDQVGALPGVRSAIADRSFPVALGPAGDGLVTGHPWASAALTPFALRMGQPPGRGEVVLDPSAARQAGAEVGTTLAVTSRAGTERYSVVGLAATPDGREPQQATVFFSPEDSDRLMARPGLVTAIGVISTPEESPAQLAERIRGLIGTVPVEVLTGDDRGRPEFLDRVESAALVVAIAGTFGGMALAVAIFVVAGTMSIAAQQRQRELALLRAIGATPSQLRRMITGEAVLMSVLAAGGGCLLGLPLARLLRDEFARREVVPANLTVDFGLLPMLIAAAATTAVAATAAALAGRRVARIRPTAALVEAEVEPRRIGWIRITLGVLALAGAGLLLRVTMEIRGEDAAAAALGLVFLVCVAVALLGPLLTAWPSRALATPLRIFGVPGYLARHNVASHTRRLAGVIAPLVLAVGFSGAGLATQSTSVYAAEQQARSGVLADYVLDGPVLPVRFADQIGQLPGVTGVTSVVRTAVVVSFREAGEMEQEVHSAQGLGGRGVANTLDLDVQAGDLTHLRGDTVALSTDRAAKLRVGVGDHIPLSLGDGTPIEARVVATYGRGLGFTDFTLPADLVLAHSTTGMPDSILVRLVEGSDRSHSIAALEKLVAGQPGVAMVDREDYRSAYAAAAGDESWLTYLLIAILVAFVAVGVINTLLIATAERLREFTLLRLLGLTRLQVLRMVLGEGVVVAATAIGFGGLAAASTLVPVSLALTGQPVPHTPPGLYVGVTVGVLALTLTTMLLATGSALRGDLAAATRDRS